MYHRARAAKTSAASSISPSKSKRKSIPIRKDTHGAVQKKTPVKKSSPTKQHLEQTSTTITEPRPKRLSSLTASTLLQYCTSILSPSRKPKSTPISSNNSKTKIKSPKNDKKRLSDIKPTQTEVSPPTRTRREASSRASAMIMQQNEIERSRYHYSLSKQPSTSVTRRHRTNKADISPEKPFQFNIPSIPPLPAPAPSIEDLSNQTEYEQPLNAITTKSTHLSSSESNSKCPSLTEDTLAEHDRLHETIHTHHPSKRDKLIKWTEELALCGRLSPPYSKDEIPPESIDTDSTNSDSSVSHTNTKETSSTLSVVDLKTINPISTNTSSPTPTFLFPSAAYPLDLRSFYPLLSCWQYPTWPFQPLVNHKPSIPIPQPKTKKSITFNAKKQSIDSIPKQKKDALTLHLHTHHHHHIHNSNPTKVQEKSSSVINKEQLVETQTILPLSVNNIVKTEHQQTSENEVIKKTTRRKSSPVKRHINGAIKTTTSPVVSNNAVITSPKKSLLNNLDNSPSGSRRVLKRRSVSAATVNSTTIISRTGKNSRGKRTISASSIPLRSNKKRSHSSASVTLPLSNKNSNQRKKPKISNYWILFGKSEQKLVSINIDKPPVFRQCYSSIRHITEKDVIKSNDCVILRPETGARNNTTPYLAKVKWFWEEPTSGEIQMSLMWYYHPEHAELPSRVKEHFFPNELLASKYSDCVNVACIEDKCYVLNLNEYNRYCLRENSPNLFEHPEPIGQLKNLLNKNTSTIHHRPLPGKTVGNQNIFFCRYVYDYRAKRILKNPSLTSVTTASSM